MNDMEFSKYLAYILRHHPETIDLELEENGWVEVNILIQAINQKSKYHISLEDLKRIVENDNKKRYSFDKEGLHIRANQGHSIKNLKMDFKEIIPPKYLYHGTAKETLPIILKSGELKPMSRQMVHLSKDVETAIIVGNRHGNPVILKIDTQKAQEEGKKFFISENGVYLVDQLDIHLCEVLENIQKESESEERMER